MKENAIKIMLDTYIGIYYQAQTQISIVSFKVISMVGTHKQKSLKETSFIILMRSTIKW